MPRTRGQQAAATMRTACIVRPGRLVAVVGLHHAHKQLTRTGAVAGADSLDTVIQLHLAVGSVHICRNYTLGPMGASGPHGIILASPNKILRRRCSCPAAYSGV